MKETILLTVPRRGAHRISAGSFPLMWAFMQFTASAQDVNLGTANNFAVLSSTAVTSTGNTVITGNVGEYSGTSVTGFLPGIVNGTTYVDDAVAQQAQIDLATAYNQAAGLSPTGGNLTGQNLGGLTLTPGVYSFSSSAQLTGKLTLNDLGNPDAVFVFQIGSTLTTAPGSSIVTINDGGSTTPGISVFWQVGSSATLNTTTAFEGNILADASITLDTGASDLDGRLLAENGAVTLDDNSITAPPAELLSGSTVPDTGSTLVLLASGMATLMVVGRRFAQGKEMPAATL